MDTNGNTNKEPILYISPTLLDSFCNYLNAENNWIKFYGDSDEPSISLADYETQEFNNLIDRINRKPHEPIEAADRGTCFNDIVDTLLNGKPCGRTKMERVNDTQGNVVGIKTTLPDSPFTFFFDVDFCREAAAYFGKGGSDYDKCVNQLLVEADIETKYGVVNLYGFIDEMRRDTVYDIKTTSRYEFGKYMHYNQRYVYPYCLIESGMMNEVNFFEFTAYALKGGTSRTPLITGTRYSEVYNYNHEEAKLHITQTLERFIDFINANKELITDTNIFTRHEHKH